MADTTAIGMEQEVLARELREMLSSLGAKCVVDDGFRERYGLDFLITGFDRVHTHINMGVHLTVDRDDLEQLEHFSEGARRGVAAKSVYIEIDESTLSTGGVFAASTACLALLFDGALHDVRSTGVRIGEDCRFELFETDESINRLHRMAEDAELRIGDQLEGRIIAYFTNKGFGFIETERNRKYFFHIANIGDDDLRARLPTYRPGETIPVTFQYGGDDGQRYPKAFNVVTVDID